METVTSPELRQNCSTTACPANGIIPTSSAAKNHQITPSQLVEILSVTLKNSHNAF